MKIKTKILFKEYCKLLFKLAYKKPILKLIVGVGFMMIIWILGYYLDLIPVPKPKIYQFITLTLIAIAQPLGIFLTIKRSYDSSNHLAELIEINITHEEINVRGDSFYTEFVWDKIFKVDEETNYFLIYQNNFTAVIISKKDLTKTECLELKEIFKSISNIPINLKD